MGHLSVNLFIKYYFLIHIEISSKKLGSVIWICNKIALIICAQNLFKKLSTRI